MPRQNTSPVQKTINTPKRRNTSTPKRRTSKKSEPLVNEAIVRPSTPSQSGGSGAQILVLLIVIVLLGAAGYYWFTQQNKTSSDAVYQDYQIPLGVNVPVAEEPPVEPMWQKYQNESARYSFEYPQDWSVTASSTSGNRQTVVLTGSASTTISVVTARTPKPLTQYVSELDTIAKTAAAGKPSINIEESRDVAVNDIPVIARRQTLLATGQQELIAYFGIKDYIVSIAVTDAQMTTSSVQMYESLVNSFTLIASTTPAVATTTDMTTATSTQGVQ
jgi:hypothetical protein